MSYKVEQLEDKGTYYRAYANGQWMSMGKKDYPAVAVGGTYDGTPNQSKDFMGKDGKMKTGTLWLNKPKGNGQAFQTTTPTTTDSIQGQLTRIEAMVTELLGKTNTEIVKQVFSTETLPPK